MSTPAKPSTKAAKPRSKSRKRATASASSASAAHASEFCFDPRAKVFRHRPSGRICRGAHAYLRGLFYPTYQSTWRPGDMARVQPDGASAFARRGRRFAHGIEAAKRRGIRVDRAMAQWVRSPLRLPKGAGTLATNAIAAMKDLWKWTPLASQGVIGQADAGVVTRFDLVLRPPLRGNTYELIMCQMKQGMEGYWAESRGQFLSAPFETVASCPRTHAILQALLEAHLYESTHGERPTHAYVVRTSTEGVERVVARSPHAADAAHIDGWVPKAELYLQQQLLVARTS